MLEHRFRLGRGDNFFRNFRGALLHAHAGKGAERSLTDMHKQFLEHVEAFTLVLQLGIALAVTAQADAVAQEVHVAEVFLPAAIQFLKQEVTQQVRVQRPGLFPQLGHDGQHQFLRLFTGRQGRIAGQHAVDVHNLGQAGAHGLFIFDVACGLGNFEPGIHIVQQIGQILVQDGLKIRLLHQIPAQAVDDGTLLVHDVVIVQQGLTDFKVMAFHALLGILDGAGNHVVLDGLAFLHPEFLHEPGKAVGTEQAHEIVFERQIEARGARIALTAGTAAQLVVDTAALVAFGAEDVQAAEFDDAFPELDVRTAPRHVGGDGHLAGLTGLRDDFGFLRVVLGVEYAVRHAFTFQELRNEFGRFDGNRTHQHGLARGVQFLDGLNDGLHLFTPRPVDEVRHVLADHGAVRRNGGHFQTVDLGEFHGFGVGRAGHARQLVIHAEIVLERDAGEGLVLGGDGDVFLGFESLMQAVAEPASGHEAARELVDDDDLIVLHDVVDVAAEYGVRLEGLQHMMLRGDVGGVVEVLDAELFFHVQHAFVGERRGFALFVDRVVLFLFECADNFVHLLVQIGGFVGRAGDDERRTGFVDQDGVHFVDDGVMVAPAARRKISCCRAGSRSRTRCSCRR